MCFPSLQYLSVFNLDTVFLLSALKMPIKSVTSHQAEIRYLEEAKSPFIFRFCIELYIHISTFKYVLTSLLEIKSFASIKNESLLFWTRVHFKWWESTSPKF